MVEMFVYLRGEKAGVWRIELFNFKDINFKYLFKEEG